MSAIKGKGPVFDPGLCRCCGTMKKCRVLNVEYESLGQKEVYSNMMADCFGLFLSHLEGKLFERLVCATCVMRLREAFTFRAQVVQCEEAFIQMKMYDCDNPDPAKPEGLMSLALVKVEMAEPDEKAASDGDDDDDVYNNDNAEPTEIMTIELKPDMNFTENSSEALPPAPVTRQPEVPKIATVPLISKQKWWLRRQPTTNKPKLPISKVQELIRERDTSYMIDTNLITMVENSFICPFKCRHNNLLCYYCGNHFNDPLLLREHTLTHSTRKFKIHDHKNMVKFDITRIDCRLCDTRIGDLEEFKRHVVNVHSKKYYFETKDTVLPFRLIKDDMRCAVCNATFPYFHALNKHMNEHFSNFICETCGLGFVDSHRFVMHQTRHEQGSYPCETCGKLFKSLYNRELHVDRVHKKKGRVYCPKCDVRLMSHPQKLKHLAEAHGEQPTTLPCTYCDKVFETRRNLTIHWRKEHLKDFRYDCQVCGQKFFTRFALNNHMPTHTGERNFKCKICEKSYPRLKTLKEHMRIHTNDRRYRCHICGQAFIQNCSLKGHMKSQHPEYG